MFKLKKIFASFILGFLLFAVYAFYSPYTKPVFADITSANNDYFTNNTEHIEQFTSDITLTSDAKLNVKEKIQVYFPVSKHGIYRYIPTQNNNKSWWQFNPRVKLKSVKYYPLNETNNKKSKYTTDSVNGNYVIKIGEENKLIDGAYIYEIEYEYTNVILYNKDFDELYFNVTGNGWNMPINNVKANINVVAQIQDSICYTGYVNSKEQNCSFIKQDSNTISVNNTRSFNGSISGSGNNSEGLTFSLKLQKGVITDTTSKQKTLSIIGLLGCLWFIPLGFIGFLLWFLYGKDPNPETVIPLYQPEKDITPIFAGYLYSQDLKNKYISAEIIYLAIQGYIKIKKIEKTGIFSSEDYEFILVKSDFSDLQQHSKDLLNEIFKNGLNKSIKNDLSGMLKKALNIKTKDIKMEDKKGSKEANENTNISVKLSSLKNEMFKFVKSLETYMKDKILQDGLFIKSSESLKVLMIIGSIFLIIFGFCSILGIIAYNYTWFCWLFSIILGAVIIICFSFVMTKRSKIGNQKYTQLLGLKLYIDKAEKYRIEFHNDPKKAITIFETLLPFAMVFNLEKKWAKEFEDLYTKNPSWYDGGLSPLTTFNVINFTNSLNNIDNSINSAVTAPSTSGGSGLGGGGFSGGGFGGGGGGSW